ncbi:MAG: DUF1003 domain-containing protein [archaeon]
MKKKNNCRAHLNSELTLGQRYSDKLTAFCGNWRFIISLFVFMFIWICFNVVAFIRQWDPYPFILLNFVLSCLAAIQAPIILMSQKRVEDRDRIKAERDYMVNRKSEREVEHIQKELDVIKRLIIKIKK